MEEINDSRRRRRRRRRNAWCEDAEVSLRETTRRASRERYSRVILINMHEQLHIS